MDIVIKVQSLCSIMEVADVIITGGDDIDQSNEYKRKKHPTFIKNGIHVSLYMLDVATNSSRPILRIIIITWSLTPLPLDPIVCDDDLIEDESLGYYSMNMDDHPNGIERS
ncbi:hypothetical protein H5410_056370 [Solanum commersonii]|uniref:Uncharacterized protein n=1 Tax=Solanum commersonii TaxID=4109 RepID=A0A9J5WM23_SOLCO|nr:hypothetical protein H5410_056370 [Solanum commersonii]